MTSGPFRVVHHGGNAQRFRAVRSPGANPYVSAAQARMRGALAQGQPGMFGDTYGTNPASPGAGGSDVEGGLASSVGLTNPSSHWSGGAHAGPGGLPGSSLNDAFGAGTLLGALAGMSDAGRAVAALSHAHHGGPGSGMSNPFGVGGMLYGRGIGTELVSGKGAHAAYIALAAIATGFAKMGTDAAVTIATENPVAGEAAGYLAAGVSAGLFWYLDPYRAHSGSKGSGSKGSGSKGSGSKGGTKEFDPWYGIMYGQRGRGGGGGNYPRVTPGQSGRPTVSLYMMQHFAEALKRIGQQAHSPEGSGGGGGGTSTAPERLLFHGAKHWYDVIADQM